MSRLRLLLFGLALLGLSACSGDDEAAPTATATSPAATSAATATPEAPTATVPASTVTATSVVATATSVATATPAPNGDEWGPQAIWAYFDLTINFFETCPDFPDAECVRGVAEDNGASPQALAFLDENGTFLIDFEEHGVVDFGAISAPWWNMSRPEPVFLNGDFGFQPAYGLLPQDWQSGPSYQGLPLSIAWMEYAVLVDVESTATGQRFELEAPVRECRACEDLGVMPLEAFFDAGGALTEVNVLEFRP